MKHRIGSLAERAGGALGQILSGAVLLREAVRTSRRWQTWFVRTAFSGALMIALLLGMWAAVNATRAANVDAANLAWLGRGLFVGLSVTLTLLALAVAPITTASAIIEETDERTMEMLILTPLRPAQILGAKVLSRIGVLLTVVAGALPVMALVVNLGGVGTVEVLAVAVHTLTTVVMLAALGAFFALFTKSPALAMMASAGYAVPFFVLLPAAYGITTWDVSDTAQFSPFAAGMAKDPWALVTPLSFLPSLVVIGGLTVPLFQLAVSNADLQQSFSDEIWRTPQWAMACGIWLVTALFTLPFAVPIVFWLQNAASPPLGVLTGPVHAVVLIWLWLLFTALATLGTWAYLRIGMDVVDGVDGLFRGAGLAPAVGRASRTIGGTNPVWWREARPRAWLGTSAPVFVTWGMLLLGVFQSGSWLVPGGLLALGAANGAAAIAFASWLAARSVAEERRRGTLELLLTTTLPTGSIVLGKLAGAVFPSVPLLLLSLPLMAFGLPHLHVVSLFDGATGSIALFARGVATWVWMVPVWLVAVVASLAAAIRLARPQAAFSVVLGAMATIWGLPAILARVFPDLLLVTIPARVIAPPLAGGFAWWQLGLSLVLTLGAAVALLVGTTRRMRAWVGAGAVLLLVALAPGPARADPPDPTWIARLEQLNRIRMTATPLGDGISREDRLTTVRIRIENLGPGTVGTVSLAERVPNATGSTRTWQRRVELPDGAEKEVLLAFEPGVGDPERLLELRTREGRIAVAPFRLRPVGRDDVTIGVVGTDPLGLANLVQATGQPVPGRAWRAPTTALRPEDELPPRTVHTGLVTPQGMPVQSAGWGALDWVVWPDADPSGVSAAQVEALRFWVADGGHLLLTVTDRWRQLADSPLGPCLPVILDGVREADPGPLARLLELPGTGLAPIAIAAVRPGREAEVRARTPDGDPLWVSAPYGLGSVHVVTADLGTEPLLVRGQEAAWRRLLTLPGVGGNASDQLVAEGASGPGLHRMLNLDWVEPSFPTFSSDREEDPELVREARIRARLSDIPGVAPLPLAWLVAFSAVYLLAIGPLDWLFLRAIGRQPLTWITFPILIALFTGASLMLTSYAKGSQAVMKRVEVLDVLTGTGLSRGTTWLGVFSTRKTRIGLVGGWDDAVVTPLAEPGFQTDPVLEAGGGPGTLSWDAETWTLAYARSDWTGPVPDGLVVRRDEGRTWIRNRLGWDLEDVGVSIPGRDGGRVVGWVRLGPLADGAELELPATGAVLPLESAAPGDTLAWAVDTFAPGVSSARGSLDAEQGTVVLGVGQHAFEPVGLTGSTPVEQPLTVVRMALRCGDEPIAPCTWGNP